MTVHRNALAFVINTCEIGGRSLGVRVGQSKGKPIYEVPVNTFRRVKRGNLLFILLFLIVMGVWIVLYAKYRYPFEYNIVFGIGVLGYLLIMIDYLKMNRFGIYENGISPPSRPLSMILTKTYFIPYSEVVDVNLESSSSKEAEGVEFDPHTYYEFNLRNGKTVTISVTGWFGSLHRYVRMEREIKEVYRLLWMLKDELERDLGRPLSEFADNKL
jgi:hypothetical protein